MFKNRKRRRYFRKHPNGVGTQVTYSEEFVKYANECTEYSAWVAGFFEGVAHMLHDEHYGSHGVSTLIMEMRQAGGEYSDIEQKMETELGKAFFRKCMEE